MYVPARHVSIQEHGMLYVYADLSQTKWFLTLDLVFINKIKSAIHTLEINCLTLRF